MSLCLDPGLYHKKLALVEQLKIFDQDVNLLEDKIFLNFIDLKKQHVASITNKTIQAYLIKLLKVNKPSQKKQRKETVQFVDF